MGGYIVQETTSNGNLCSRSIVTKDTIDPKGWPHPEGRQWRRNTVEATHTNQVQRRGTQDKGAGLPREKAGHLPGPTQAAAHRVRLRQGTPHEGKDQEHHRTKESRGTVAPRGQADKYLTKNQVNNLHRQATEGGQQRINLNHFKPAANTGSERKEPK